MTSTRASLPSRGRPLDAFEQSLLTELRHHVAERGAVPAPAGRARPPRRRRRLAALGAGALAAGTLATGGLLLRPDAAFAVQETGDGDIVVTIKSLEDADGLEKALAEHGVEAEVEYGGELPEVGGEAPAIDDEVPDAESGQAESGQGDEPGLSTGGESSEAVPAEPPAGDDVLGCGGIGVEMSAEGAATFRLPAEAVDSDALLRIHTAGSIEKWSMISVQWDRPLCDQAG